VPQGPQQNHFVILVEYIPFQDHHSSPTSQSGQRQSCWPMPSTFAVVGLNDSYGENEPPVWAINSGEGPQYTFSNRRWWCIVTSMPYRGACVTGAFVAAAGVAGACAPVHVFPHNRRWRSIIRSRMCQSPVHVFNHRRYLLLPSLS
jgi:hypothetical protein